MYFQANDYLVFFIFIHGCKGKVQLAVGNEQLAGKPSKWMKLMIKKRGCLKRNQICHIEFIEMFTDLIPTDCYISTSSI